MSIKSGEELLYVDGTGKIHDVVAIVDERNGAAKVRRKENSSEFEIGTLHLCRTRRAAEIVAAPRIPKL